MLPRLLPVVEEVQVVSVARAELVVSPDPVALVVLEAAGEKVPVHLPQTEGMAVVPAPEVRVSTQGAEVTAARAARVAPEAQRSEAAFTTQVTSQLPLSRLRPIRQRQAREGSVATVVAVETVAPVAVEESVVRGAQVVARTIGTVLPVRMETVCWVAQPESPGMEVPAATAARADRVDLVAPLRAERSSMHTPCISTTRHFLAAQRLAVPGRMVVQGAHRAEVSGAAPVATEAQAVPAAALARTVATEVPAGRPRTEVEAVRAVRVVLVETEGVAALVRVVRISALQRFSRTPAIPSVQIQLRRGRRAPTTVQAPRLVVAPPAPSVAWVAQVDSAAQAVPTLMALSMGKGKTALQEKLASRVDPEAMGSAGRWEPHLFPSTISLDSS
jgi:hypothetical protein